MKQKRVIHTLFILVFLAATGLTAAPKTEQHKTDIRHIALDLSFDWTKKQAKGMAEITLTPLYETDRIALDAAMMTIESVSLVQGKKLAFEYAGGDKNQVLTILLGKKHNAGTELSLRIVYKTNWINATDPQSIGGSTGKGLRFLGPSSTEPKRRRQIWSMGEGEGNRYWFPGNDEPGDLRTTELKATVETAFTVVSNGRLLAQKDNGNGTKTFLYRMDQPYPNSKTALAIGEFADIIRQSGSTVLHNYTHPTEVEATTSTVERLPDMVRFFSDYTGVAYPYPVYNHVFVQELPWGAGSGSMSVLSENMVDDHGTHADFLYLWDMLEGEALAHQWFGNHISPKNWNHYWLEKAFGRYFSCLYDEYANGRAEYLLWQHSFDWGNYWGDWMAGNRRPVVPQKIDDLYAFINGNYPNSRGALVLNMLRHHLGEEKWKRAIRQYSTQYAGKTVVTDDFKNVVEAVAGEDLDWFFEQWLERVGHPTFEISKQYDVAKQQLILTVRQTQQRDTSTRYPQQDYFKGKLSIEIDHRIETVFVQAQKENIFRLPCPKPPQLVNADYESNWIAEIKFEKTFPEWLYQMQYSRDVMAQSTAIQKLAVTGMDSTTSAANKALIIQSLREFSEEKRYWRIRLQALGALQRVMTTPCADKPCALDKTTTDMLLRIAEKDEPWVRRTAIFFLGTTRDPKYADLYIRLLQDKSDRVADAAAIALGQSKSPKAFDALVAFKDKPTWKSQSLISALYGLAELEDPRGVDVALRYLNASDIPHWTLAVSIWDHRIAAALALVRMKATDKAYPIVKSDLDKAIAENQTNDIFFNLQQISTLKDPRGKEVFTQLKEKYKGDEPAKAAVEAIENKFGN